MAFPANTHQQQTVFDRHNKGDIKRACEFIQAKWPKPEVYDQPIVNSALVSYAVSTTLNSTFLLLSKGLDSMFTRNTWSKYPENPWLIYQHGEENQVMANFIERTWAAMAVPGDANNRQHVDTLAPFVVYKFNRQAAAGQPWKLVPLQCDGRNVRAEIEDVKVWSHPPRDEPLVTVLNDMTMKINGKDIVFTQFKTQVRHAVGQMKNIALNPKIPPDRKEEQKGNVRTMFDNYCRYYEEVELPSSYQWPTLQLSQSIEGVGEQRYGGTFAGVYDNKSNAVHHKFPALGVVARVRPLHYTSRKLIWEELTENDPNFTFENMFPQ